MCPVLLSLLCMVTVVYLHGDPSLEQTGRSPWVCLRPVYACIDMHVDLPTLSLFAHAGSESSQLA